MQNNIIDSIIDSHFSAMDTEEVLLNGCDSLTILSKDKKTLPSPFTCPQQLQHQLQEFAFSQDKRLDPYHPSNGGIYNGYRWHIIIEPVATNGCILSLRRHRFAELSLSDYNIQDKHLQQIGQAIQDNRHIIVCGPTGSGKTSFLAALLKEHFTESRVFILEEIPELPQISKQWVHLCTQPKTIEGNSEITMQQIFRESLRMRPEKTVVGEIREKEATTFSLLLDCAQGATFTTMHSYDLESTLQRLSKLNVTMTNYPLAVIAMNNKQVQSVESNK